MTDALPIASPALMDWMPLWKAAGCFFATFVLEDAAAVGAGLLLATGAISWPAAITACFLGIWMGDAGLYALARFGGRNWFERSSWRRFAPRVERSERWFADRGTLILIFSRMVPGTRLPTYLAAGFLRVPLPRFLLVTGTASFIWTLVVLYLAEIFGTRVTHWLGLYKYGSVALLGISVLLIIALQLLRRLFLDFDLRHWATSLERWLHWEFWPAWLFYPPVVLHYFWLSAKYRGWMLPTTANPGIFTGGMVGESKMATLAELMAHCPEFTADGELLAGTDPGSRLASLREICARRNLSYPLILKPDLGQRGDGVKLIRNEEQARAYFEHCDVALLVQRYAPGPQEAGVFYYRFPDEPRGHIFAITEKIFPYITGDGKSTISELIWRDQRARFMAAKYLNRLAARREEILPTGQTLQLVAAGNHAQGCIFRDGMHLCTPALLDRIDAISQTVPGFYIGRYDIRYASEEDLRAGKNFQVIELNGATSEATSIYDSRNSLFSAYRTLFRQWNLVFAIGAVNRRRGHAPECLWAMWRHWRQYQALAGHYPAAD